MDNLTHAFVGAALGESALAPQGDRRTRLVFLVAGIAAASAPDLDLLYTGITEKPLGYLLHHRGHTHTLPGLVALGLLLAGALWLWPAARRTMRESPRRFSLVLGAGLASHLLMDAANSYGAHLLYPWKTGWVYGDSVFILEPWFWLILGTTLAQNAATRTWRILVLLLAAAGIAGITWVGLVAPTVTTAMVATGAAAALATRRWPAKKRAIAALLASTALIALLATLSRQAETKVRRELEAGGGAIVDVVLDPNPGAPWCWSVLSLQKSNDELVARRGVLSLAAAWPAETCAAARLFPGSPGLVGSGAIAWKQEWRSSFAELQKAAREDCRARAWLQFGRVPLLAGGRLADLRFENPLRENFTSLDVDPPSPDCPAALTRWEMPRVDLFGP